jgi:hypothetical protein
MLIGSTFACLLCWGAPDWPAKGEANRDWVIEALEWRMRRGIEDCDEIATALDAMTLEWISQAVEFTVDIDQLDWPFLEKAPELLYPLIQSEALSLLTQKVDLNRRRETTVRRVRKIARRTKGIPMHSIRSDFKRMLELTENKRGHRSNKQKN